MQTYQSYLTRLLRHNVFILNKNPIILVSTVAKYAITQQNYKVKNMAFPIAGALFGVANTLIDRLIVDKNANKKAKLSLEMMQAQGELDMLAKGLEGQLKINEMEAKHPSIFVSGARPATLWVCACAFAYHYLIFPIIMAIAAFNDFDVTILPKFELADLMYVMTSLLGIGGFRTYEKIRGVARDNLQQPQYGKGSKNYEG